MTVIARDAFSGGNDTDISGRTPDGGGSGPLAVGTWTIALRVDGTDHLDISSGKLVAPTTTLADIFYALGGVTIPSADYEVRLTIDPTLVSGGFFNAYVGLRVNSATGDGYWLQLTAFEGDSYILTLLEISSGSGTQIDQQAVFTPLAAGTHLLTIRATGDAISGDLDGLLAVAGTDSTHTGIGNGGVGGYNGEASVEFRATLFEVDDTPSGGGGGTPDPCTYLASRHEFYAPARADIDGQLTDTFPGLGTLAKHPASAAVIAEDGSQGWIVGAGRAVYLDTGIAGLVAGSPVVLGDDYCADVLVQFPRVRSHNPDGEPPGCTAFPYQIVWTYEITGDDGVPLTPTPIPTETGPVTDLVGTVTVGGVVFEDFTLWDNGQPRSFTVHFPDPAPGSGNTAQRSVLFFTTLRGLDAGVHTIHCEIAWTELVAGASSFGGFASISGLPPTNPGFGGTSFFGFVPPEPTVMDFDVVGAADLDVIFGIPEAVLSNSGTLRIDEISRLEYDEFGFFILCDPPGDPGDEDGGEGEHAEAEVLVRYDEVADSGYALRLEFTHADAVYTGTVTLVKLVAGVETALLGPFDVGVAHDTLYQLRLRVAGTTLVADLDGTVLGTVTDATHATGDPGFGGFDDGDLPIGQYLYIEQFSVYNPDDEILPPCDGPGEPPGGGYPPGPPPEIQVGYWVRRNLAWRFIPLPTAALPSTATGVRRNLARRELVTLTGVPPEPFGIRQNLAWRYPFFDQGVGDPPGTGPFPPDYDPCEQLPPIEEPPEVIVGAPPERLFFTWAIGASQLGPLWTATFRAMGGSILGEISQAAARGGAIFGTPGDKHKFFRNGRYDPDLMDAWIFSLAPLAATVMAAQAAGSFAGVHAADDWENPALWPPSGLPLTEINRIAAVWKTVFDPGLRVMLRARTGQIGSTPLPNIDGIISQMRMTGTEWENAGRNAGNYARIELNFCQSRGMILHLSQNFYNGLQVRQPMTAAQVLDNAMQWLDVTASHPHGGAVYGMGGWEFTGVVTGPAYLNAYGTWRNGLAALGPPTFP